MESDRIKLVPPAMELVPGVVSAIKESQTDLRKYLVWVSASLENPEQNMRSAIDNYNAHKNELRFHILSKPDLTFIGAIGLLVRDLNVPFYEMGYWIRTSQTSNGYAYEAVSILEKYVFEKLGAKRLEIRTAAGNLKSQAIAVKAGYTKEAELVNERRLPSGEITNTLVYAKHRN